MNFLTQFLLEDILDNKNYTIYFDVDDTLSNYTQNLATTFIKDPETGEDRKIKPQDTVENIDFWINAPIIPGAKEMVDFARNNFDNVEILSAVPELSKANKELTGKRFFDAPIDGKTEWVTKNIGPIKFNWSKNGKEKGLWATPNSVLVDDKPENIRAFEQAGGIGILIDTPQGVINKLKDLLEGKEIINEGRYDSLTRMVVKDILNDWKSQYDGTPELLEFNEDYETTNSKGQSIDFELYATLNVKETKTEVYRVDGGADPLRTPAYLEVKFQVDPRDLPQKWSDIYSDLIDVVRHEIEHLTQSGSNVIPSKEMEDDEILRNLISLKVLPKSEYFKLGKEVDAMLQGMYLKAKKSKTPFKDVINNYFDKVKLSKKDRNSILDLWKQRAKALSLPLQENLTNIDYKEKIKDLTKYMLGKGMNIRPLPKVRFINDDNKNAEDFFGKTAYYDPNEKLIVLYTYGRHPKDIVRSFSHEMIHHMQNLEGRIGNGDINTTNTNEDDYLEDIEKEAYLNGNIEFRKWSDDKKKLDEGILDKTKDLISNFKLAYKDQKGDFEGFKDLFKKYISKQELTPEEKEKLNRNVIDIFKMSAIPILGISGTTLLGTLTNFLSKGKFSTFPSKFKDKLLSINEIGDVSAKVYPFSSDKSFKQIMDDAIAWKKEGGSAVYYEDELLYTFNTEKAKYIVTIQIEMQRIDYINFAGDPDWKPGPPFNTSAQVAFTTEGNPEDETTNLNEQFSVLSTITKIVLKFIEGFNKEGGNITSVYIAPKNDSDRLTKIDSKRGRFYYAYIKNNLSKIPGYGVREESTSEGNEYIEIYKTSNINEVGEANLEPYKWEEEYKDSTTVSIEFTTPSETKYEVYLESTVHVDRDVNELEALIVEFSARPKGAEGSSSKIVVNKGELYRVMSTIVDIIKHYVRKSRAKAILYQPSKKQGEDNFGSQRGNLYKAFIKKAMPGTYFEQNRDWIIAILPGNGIISEDDPKKGTGKKPKGSGRRLYTDEDPSDTVRVKFKTKEDIVDTLNKKSFKSKSHARQSQVINLIHQRVRAAYGKAKDPEVKSRLKRALDYIEKRKEASKKKTERLRKMKEASDPQAGTALPYGSGFAPVKELVTANSIICDNCGWKWAIKDGGNDLFICHKCGHDNTPKPDLFGLKAYALELAQGLEEELTKSDLNQIERIADEWFEDYGIDVEFTNHFLERVNDPRNGKPISAEELEDLFIKTAEKYGKKLSDFPDNFQAVLNDLRTSINLPFALNYDDRNNEMDLVAKTIMRKRDFKTTNPKLPLEELGKAKKGH